MFKCILRKNETRIGDGKSAIVVDTGLKGLWNRLWQQGQNLVTANVVKIFEKTNPAIEWLNR